MLSPGIYQDEQIHYFDLGWYSFTEDGKVEVTTRSLKNGATSWMAYKYSVTGDLLQIGPCAYWMSWVNEGLSILLELQGGMPQEGFPIQTEGGYLLVREDCIDTYSLLFNVN